jgi:hypothetical protein
LGIKAHNAALAQPSLAGRQFVLYEEKDGKTLLVMHELYPSKEALDAAGTGAADAMGESFEQLDELLVTLAVPPSAPERRSSGSSTPEGVLSSEQQRAQSSAWSHLRSKGRDRPQ